MYSISQLKAQNFFSYLDLMFKNNSELSTEIIVFGCFIEHRCEIIVVKSKIIYVREETKLIGEGKLIDEPS